MSAGAAAAAAAAAQTRPSQSRAGQKRKAPRRNYDDDDENDDDYAPGSSPSRSASASHSISPASRAAARQQDAKAAAPAKRQRRQQPTEKKRAPAAAAAAAAEAATEAREEKEPDPELQELVKTRERMRMGQIFIREGERDKRAYNSWLYDTALDPATAAAEEAAKSATSETMGLKSTTPAEAYRNEWLMLLERRKHDPFAGGQSNGKYCWLCEHNPSPEFGEEPNKHKNAINKFIAEGHGKDVYFVAQQIMTYYVENIMKDAEKIWSIEMIHAHLVKHIKDPAYILDAVAMNSYNVMEGFVHSGIRDKTSTDCMVKMATLVMKSVAARERVQATAGTRNRA